MTFSRQSLEEHSKPIMLLPSLITQDTKCCHFSKSLIYELLGNDCGYLAASYCSIKQNRKKVCTGFEVLHC